LTAPEIKSILKIKKKQH
jgi:hypothetical protein